MHAAAAMPSTACTQASNLCASADASPRYQSARTRTAMDCDASDVAATSGHSRSRTLSRAESPQPASLPDDPSAVSQARSSDSGIGYDMCASEQIRQQALACCCEFGPRHRGGTCGVVRNINASIPVLHSALLHNGRTACRVALARLGAQRKRRASHTAVAATKRRRRQALTRTLASPCTRSARAQTHKTA